MKNTILLFLLLAPFFSILGQQTTPKSAWLEKWENSKTYLLQIAEDMPEEHYDFKPTEDQMSFKELLLHIKSNMDWLSAAYFSEEAYSREKSTNKSYTKEETLGLLKDSFDKAYAIINVASEEEYSKEVEFFAGPKSKLQILNLLQDHVTHHRGQLLVYLNLKGIDTPRYVGW